MSDQTGIEMVWVEPGTFSMGSPESEPGRKPDESPQTVVTITEGYWLGKTEVTVGQWRALLGTNLRGHLTKVLLDDKLYEFGDQKLTIRDYMGMDRKAPPERYLANEEENLPMYFVSWHDAMEFCRVLTTRERMAGRLRDDYVYTLPTEAQWEFACRAGSSNASFAGPLTEQKSQESVLDRIAWYSANSAEGYSGRLLPGARAGPRAVGEKDPNKWGLVDMPGNLWEWCRDWYGRYPGGTATDPQGPEDGEDRVNRGGSWGSGARDERSANRAHNPPAEASAYRGFRVALCRVR